DRVGSRRPAGCLADAQAGGCRHAVAVVCRHAAGVVAGAQPQVVQGRGGSAGGIAAGIAADSARLLPAVADGAAWYRGRADRSLAYRCVAVHLHRLGDRFGAVLDAFCGTAHPERVRGDGQAPAGSSRHLACRQVGSLLQRGLAAGASGFPHRDHPRLRAHGRRIRRGADAGRQHPRRDARALGCHLQSCRGDGIQCSAVACGWHGAVLVHRVALAVSHGRQVVESGAM
ncbi:Molybdenum ABC transporter permease protein ModB, partial [Sideroxydans sp. CL21]